MSWIEKPIIFCDVSVFACGHPPPNKASGWLDRKLAFTNGAPVTEQSKLHLFLQTAARGSEGLASLSLTGRVILVSMVIYLFSMVKCENPGSSIIA